MTTSESRSKSRRQGIFRAIPRGVVLGCAGIFATLFWNILAALGADFSLRLTFALAIAVIALTIEITKELDRRKGARLESETKRRDWDKRAQTSMYQWPPAVAADADMYALGVKRGYMRLADATGGAGLPYVERDADRGAREGLQAHGQILLIGAQLSGVTRLAYEVARNERLSPIIIAPRAPDGLADIVYDLDIASHLPERTYAILWLNDIDRYKQGCDVVTLKQLRHQLPGLRVIATIATTKYPDWAAENAELREFFGMPNSAKASVICGGIIACIQIVSGG